MSDVLKIALDRRAQLHEEVAKLDEFIRMAETLMRGTRDVPAMPVGMPAQVPAAERSETSMRSALRRTTGDESSDAGDVQRPSIIRRSANAGG